MIFKSAKIRSRHNLFQGTRLEFEDINIKELSTYLAVMIGKEELGERGLLQHIPRRTVQMEGRQRAAPSIAYLDSTWYWSTTRGEGRTRKDRWNWEEWVEPCNAKKKTMVALMMREMVRLLITKHHYTVDGKLFQQCDGGPIGERVTTVLARMVLHQFDSEFNSTLCRLQLSLPLLQRYVDDVNAAGGKLSRRMKVVVKDGKAELEWGEEDNNLADDAFSARVYQEIANTIRPKSIIMEVDFPSNNADGKLPILDMKVWVEESQVLFLFYQKPMASRALVSPRSAITTRETKNILLEEGSRRLRACSPSLPWVTKAAILTNFAIQMMDSGHKLGFRDMIVSRVVAKYLHSLGRHERGIHPIYRSREERDAAWAGAGGRPDKSDWFRKSGASAILTVPATEGSKLAEKVREALAAAPNPTGCSTLVREQPGPSIKQQLVRSNPRPREECGRELCPFRMAGEKCRERCYREGIGYMGRCLRCAEEQRQGGKREEEIVWQAYQGESSRSVPTRASEHYCDYKAAMKKPAPVRRGEEEEEEGSSSWMADHTRSHHGGIISANPLADYDFLLVEQNRKPLLRQLEEAVRIKVAKASGFVMLGRGPRAKKLLVNRELLNRKMENYSPWLLTGAVGG